MQYHDYDRARPDPTRPQQSEWQRVSGSLWSSMNERTLYESKKKNKFQLKFHAQVWGSKCVKAKILRIRAVVHWLRKLSTKWICRKFCDSFATVCKTSNYFSMNLVGYVLPYPLPPHYSTILSVRYLFRVHMNSNFNYRISCYRELV